MEWSIATDDADRRIAAESDVSSAALSLNLTECLIEPLRLPALWPGVVTDPPELPPPAQRLALVRAVLTAAPPAGPARVLHTA